MARLGLQDRPDNAAPGPPVQPGGVSSQSGATPAQHTEGQQVHPAYPDLPPGVPRDEEGIRKHLLLTLHSELDGICY